MSIITGPNMGGKSVYIRQIALLQIMAQIGCYLPAESAQFRITDRIFVRLGFSDDMECNASTFIVELKEINYIMKTLTPQSLVIIDELCRGTSVEEGASIAWAILEELLASAAFIFVTTHFLFLTKLEELYCNVSNPNMELWSVLPHYVDKTKVAKHFFRSRHKIVMISAPQGFLKSTNMRFMATFVDGIRHPSAAQQRKRFWLEMGLDIMKETELVEEFMGRWPYLHLSFPLSGARCSIHTMAALVRQLYEQHKLLVASDRLSATQRFNFDVYRNFADFKATGERKLADAVAVLCDILRAHYGRPVFVFIDNYDWPLLEALAKGKPLANIQPFLGRMLSSLYRSEAVQRVLLNGVSSFTAALEDTRVKVYRFLHEHKFCKYYGFSEADVASLVNANHCSREIGSQLLERHYLSMGAKRKVYSPEWLLDSLKHCVIENAVWFEAVLYKPVMTTISLRRRLAPLERGEVARATVPPQPSSYSDLLQVNRLLNGDISDLEDDEVELVLRLLFEFGVFTPVEAASPSFSLACYHPQESVRLRMMETSRMCAQIKARAV